MEAANAARSEATPRSPPLQPQNARPAGEEVRRPPQLHPPWAQQGIQDGRNLLGMLIRARNVPPSQEVIEDRVTMLSQAMSYDRERALELLASNGYDVTMAINAALGD